VNPESSFPCRIRDGILLINPKVKKQIADYCSGKKDADYWMILKRRYGDRSLDQNAWLWGPVYEQILKTVGEHTGIEKMDLHTTFKAMFSRHVEMVKVGERVIEVVKEKGSSEMTTVEFMEFVEQIRLWAGEELGIVIPDPEPALKKRFGWEKYL